MRTEANIAWQFSPISGVKVNNDGGAIGREGKQVAVV